MTPISPNIPNGEYFVDWFPGKKYFRAYNALFKAVGNYFSLRIYMKQVLGLNGDTYPRFMLYGPACNITRIATILDMVINQIEANIETRRIKHRQKSIKERRKGNKLPHWGNSSSLLRVKYINKCIEILSNILENSPANHSKDNMSIYGEDLKYFVENTTNIKGLKKIYGKPA